MAPFCRNRQNFFRQKREAAAVLLRTAAASLFCQYFSFLPAVCLLLFHKTQQGALRHSPDLLPGNLTVFD